MYVLYIRTNKNIHRGVTVTYSHSINVVATLCSVRGSKTPSMLQPMQVYILTQNLASLIHSSPVGTKQTTKISMVRVLKMMKSL